MAITVAKFTVEDYHHLIETGVLEGRTVELLQGLIVEMSPEGPIHSDLIREIADWFRANLDTRAKVSEAHPVTLPDGEPEPDIALVARRRYRNRHPGPQDIFLIIEVASSSLDKDLNEKAIAYASAGIPEYWLVDLKNQRAIVMQQPRQSAYQIRQDFTTGEITPQQFPDLRVAVEFLLSA